MGALGRRLRGLPYLISSFFVLIIVRMALTFRQTVRIGRHIDIVLKRANVTAGAGRGDLQGDLATVAWSVSASCKLVPGATCLTQAYAGAWLLARRARSSEIKITLPLGVSDEFKPHAWLIHDGTIILGGTSQEYRRHQPLHNELHYV